MTLRRPHVAGFSLVELLVVLVLTGLVLAGLAMVTRQWLPNWHRGIDRIEHTEQVALALDRIADDLAATEFVPATLERRHAFFRGSASAVTFVRTALGPNARPGLEIVRLAETAAPGGPALARSTALYVPRHEDAPPPAFGSPVLLLHPPYRVEFSYAGADGIWSDQWIDLDLLPRAVRIVVRDGRTGRALDVSTAVDIRAELPAACVSDVTRYPCKGVEPAPDAGPPASGKEATQ